MVFPDVALALSSYSNHFHDHGMYTDTNIHVHAIRETERGGGRARGREEVKGEEKGREGKRREENGEENGEEKGEEKGEERESAGNASGPVLVRCVVRSRALPWSVLCVVRVSCIWCAVSRNLHALHHICCMCYPAV